MAFSLVSPACADGDPVFQVFIYPYQQTPTQADNDPLFLVEIRSFSGTLTVNDLAITLGDYPQNPLVVRRTHGTGPLRAGDLLLCSEPGQNLYSPQNALGRVSVSILRKTTGETAICDRESSTNLLACVWEPHITQVAPGQ